MLIFDFLKEYTNKIEKNELFLEHLAKLRVLVENLNRILRNFRLFLSIYENNQIFYDYSPEFRDKVRIFNQKLVNIRFFERIYL